MTEMIERAARHLCRTHQEMDFAKAKTYARTVIEAMAEPTDEMRHNYPPFDPSRFATREDSYRAMINGALARHH